MEVKGWLLKIVPILLAKAGEAISEHGPDIEDQVWPWIKRLGGKVNLFEAAENRLRSVVGHTREQAEAAWKKMMDDTDAMLDRQRQAAEAQVRSVAEHVVDDLEKRAAKLMFRSILLSGGVCLVLIVITFLIFRFGYR